MSGSTTGPDPWPVPESWAREIETYAQFQRIAGRPESTIYTRSYQLGRIGRELLRAGVAGPWDVATEDLVCWLAREEWRPETRRSFRTGLRGFYRWGIAFGRTTVNPTLELPAIHVSPGTPRPAPDDRIKFALAGADSRVRLMILLGAMCGLRRAEIAKVHAEDIGPGGLRVVGKGGRVRTVPMPEIVRQAMAGRRGWIFPSGASGKKHFSAGYVGKLISAQLGPDITAHMLRHRFASVAYSAERDLRAVQTLLGHTKPETTAIYTAIPNGALEAAVSAASRL